MKPLPTEFRSDGYCFQLLRRAGTVALLAKRKTPRSCPNFEVVIIQTRPAEQIFGNRLPAREMMPPSESWGVLGWSDSNFPAAETRFNRLCRALRKGRIPFQGFAVAPSRLARHISL